ncbi:ATP phosphoribosyltransferase regulatory subunit [Tistlia consotensis]|uniref:ATP phosphoribosyltransferase regulatory subunit n=1 Tax=Tistlia consotensis USBA 355 TaxID=560819 RepID=A0A1Y6CGL0_9PROT|nr:ATP phosphoribosyltransferase regulatory subunit [Tistlia consotensis]SMF60369.1 ATP phosphoribosyltransferase regulatory subunit [Tistlia consotensis USBA 355]SNR93476.1 ATP phosphoribosyltransferase regulatory subunit [Tistlia consotensis]
MSDRDLVQLLPRGMRDLLPPHAAEDRRVETALLQSFERCGYELVAPPLIEYDESLSRLDKRVSTDLFRSFEAATRQTVGVRPDIAPQVARVAGSRLTRQPRPLRLCYAGPTVRMAADGGLEQNRQVGVTLFGSEAAAAIAEVAAAAVRALNVVGLDEVNLDLTLPQLVDTILTEAGVRSGMRRRAESAMARKAREDLAGQEPKLAERLVALLDASGPVEDSLPRLRALDLPAEAKRQVELLAAVAERLKRSAPGATLLLDPVESRGFEAHADLGFALFVGGARSHVGRGGTYRMSGFVAEPSVGCSLSLDQLYRVVPEAPLPERVLAPFDIAPERLEALRREGRIAVAALEPVADLDREAVRLGFTHIFDGAGVRRVG